MTDSPTDAQVDELDAVYAAAQQRTARLKRLQSLMSFALMLVIVGAILLIYLRVADMYTEEKFRPVIAREFEVMTPDIQEQAQLLMDDVVPVYRDLAKERLEGLGPELREAAEQELYGLSDRLRDAAETQIAESMARIEQRQVERLQEEFPELEDAGAREDMRNAFVGDMEVETIELLGTFHERVMTDLSNISGTVEAFRPNRFEEMDRSSLLRTYMHLWLMLMDYEVMAADGLAEGGSDG